jgi:predicted nucleic acid-binding Zn ribbon protein
MAEVVARLGGDQRATEHRVFECFQAVIGPALQTRAQADALRGQTLFVRVTSSALAHELSLLKRTILDQMEARLGPNVVNDLRTRVGPLEAR